MKTQVHEITVCVVDTDDLGADSVVEIIEDTKYPNCCIQPRVVDIKTKTVDWSDDHPLNKGDAWKETLHNLFEKNDGVHIKVWSWDDWGGVYVNGVLVSEGHNANREFVYWIDHVGKCNILSFESLEFCSDDLANHPFYKYLQQNACCPKTLTEIGVQ